MSKFRFYILSLFADAILVNASIIIAFLVRFNGQLPAYNFKGYLSIAPLITLIYLGCGWIYGLYEAENVDTPWGTTRIVVTAVSLGTLLVAAVAFFGGTATVSFARWTLILSWAFDIILLISWRIVFLRLFPVKWPQQRTAILGVDISATDLAQALGERSKWGWDFIGYIEADAQDLASFKTNASLTDYDESIDRSKILGTVRDTQEIIVQHDINRLLIASPINIRGLIASIILDRKLPVTIDVVPEIYEISIGRIDSIVGDIPLVRISTGNPPRYLRVMKRGFDVIGSVILGILTLPIWAIAGLMILIDDGGPVMYSQERVGQDKTIFKIYKFRTMRNDAEKTSGPVLATEDDRRITRVGRVLRKYRIDELPQLINIIEGSMSFIGPRPERPFFVEENERLIHGYTERFRAKPGATGLAQVNGGYATTPERKLKYDLMYLYNQSISMDAQIIVETLKVILTGKGAR